jgi:hypothetical protein
MVYFKPLLKGATGPRYMQEYIQYTPENEDDPDHDEEDNAQNYKDFLRLDGSYILKAL